MLDGRHAIRRLLFSTARFSGIAPLAARMLSGVGAILMLHRVNSLQPSPVGFNSHLTITPAFLDAVIADMKANGYRFVSLDEAVSRLSSGRKLGRFATITLDDAYLDNLTDALPVFEKHQTPATIFVAPGLISGEVLPWWEVIEELVQARNRVWLPTETGVHAIECRDLAAKRAAAARLAEHLTVNVAEADQQDVLRRLITASGSEDGPAETARRFMNWDELRSLARHPLVELGAHTVTHCNLKRLAPDLALAEMTESADIIARETGSRPVHFAYPYGYEAAVGPCEVGLAEKAGFRSAVTTRHGVLSAEHAAHLHALPRISLNGHLQDVGHVRTMLSGLTTAIANSGKTVVTV